MPVEKSCMNIASHLLNVQASAAFDSNTVPTVKNRGSPMISAIVLAPDTPYADDIGHEREIVVRSLVWLVSAVVSGVVRDVTLAVPAGLGLSEVADQAGCELIEADREAGRLALAIEGNRGRRLLILKTGFQPGQGLIEELDSFVRRAPQDAVALVLATPETAFTRLFPDRAPIVGMLIPRSRMGSTDGGFAKLARAVRRGTPLRTRAARIA